VERAVANGLAALESERLQRSGLVGGARGKAAASELFVNARGRPLSRRGMAHILKRRGKTVERGGALRHGGLTVFSR